MQVATELYIRSATVGRSHVFFDKLSTHLTRDSLQFNLYPQIVSPHSTQITSLDMDNASEGRFLLCGSKDCTISVYDLSLLGSDYSLTTTDREDLLEDRRCSLSVDLEEQHSTWKSKNRFRPIAKSPRDTSLRPDGLAMSDPLFVPRGHSHSVTQVLWYPVDTGVFLSSDAVGNVLLWDTNLFTPVSCIRKSSSFASASILMNHGSGRDTASSLSSSPCSIASMDLPKRTNSSHLLLAIGSIGTSVSSAGNLERLGHVGTSRMGSRAMAMDDDRVVYLCDIRSGSMTHQLVGHGFGGISCVKWSPIHDYLLASGSRDGTIKLWDIRKAGSTACLATLDRDNKTVQEVSFGSWRKKKKKQKQATDDKEDGQARYHRAQQCFTTVKKKQKTQLSIVAPGDYSQVECSSHVQSHAGSVSCLDFTPDGNYMVSASVHDGLKLWNMQSGTNFGELLPTRYTGPLGSSNSVQNPLDPMQKIVPMKITQSGCSLKSATVWVGGRNNKLLGYKVHGEGGAPDKVLAGHFDQVTAIASQDNCARLFSGGMDGMILGYGNRNEFEVDIFCNHSDLL
jgi:FOG: WD40 repeat